MGIALKITSGPLLGNIYKISDGLTIGRLRADLNLQDQKVSGLHAKVSSSTENESDFQLVDLGSRNGIMVGEEKVDPLDLKAGTLFRLGNTPIEIIEVDEDDPLLIDPRETWKDILIQFNNQLARNIGDTSKPVGPFDPVLKLQFIQGRQLSTEWIIGYGPREIGLISPEFPIHEPNMPEVCFSVYPNAGSWFKTDHPRQVRLNNREVSVEQLKIGDKIHIGETIIQVSFFKKDSV